MNRTRVLLASVLSVAVVAVTATVVVAAAASDDAATAEPVASVVGPSAPAGQRAVSYRGVQIFVPASSTANAWSCGQATTDRMIGGGPSGVVVVGDPPGGCDRSLYFVTDGPEVQLGPSESAHGAALAKRATAPTVVNGVDAFTSCATCAEGTFANGHVLYFPEQRVVLTATVYGPDTFADRVLGSARVVDVDANGCATRRTDPTPEPGEFASVWDGASAPSSTTAASPSGPASPALVRMASARLCTYADGVSAGSAVLRGTHVAEQGLGDVLVPTEWGEMPAARCPERRTRQFDVADVRVERADGGTASFTVVADACTPYSVTEAGTTLNAFQQGLDTLEALRGS